MRKKNVLVRKDSHLRKAISHYVLIIAALKMLVVAALIPGCTKDNGSSPLLSDLFTSADVQEIYPVNEAESVAINSAIGVTFKTGTETSKLTSASLDLKTGDLSIPGNVMVAGNSVYFDYGDKLEPMTEYSATLKTTRKNGSGSEERVDMSWKFKTGKDREDKSLSVVSVTPANQAAGVPLATQVTVTLNKEVKPWMKGLISINMKAGAATVAGTISFDGNKAIFDPSADLLAGTTYACTFVYGNFASGNDDIDDEDDDEGDEDEGDDDKSGDYTWSFTTITGQPGTSGTSDVKAPEISAVAPANNAAAVTTSAALSATFSEAMNPATITTATFLLKQGTTAVSGSVTYSGTTAKFTPSSPLAAGTTYSATITTGAKDVAGNPTSSDYVWSFTTATATSQVDLTAPTILTTSPASNAASVAVTAKVTVTFSEAMDASTVSSSTFTLRQGNTSVTGTVTYSGSTATFTPSGSLTAATVYTATLTTGVKDAAGNALASTNTWSFTTAAAPAAGLSFSGDVIPVLNKCNGCHTHPWTTSSVASTYYTNLVNGGYVNPANYTSSKIYAKLNSGHSTPTVPQADVDKIINWMKEGSKNN